MMLRWVYLLLLLWSFTNASTDTRENEETQKKKTETSHPTMAPNSKFLNPHVDDDTNLQFAIAAFGDDSKAPEGSKSKASEILTLTSHQETTKPSDDWRLIPILNSLTGGNKSYKSKKL